MVCGAITRRGMAVTLDDLAVVHDEDAGHLESIARKFPNGVSFEQRSQSLEPHPRPEELKQRTPLEFERSVEILIGIGHTWQVIKTVGREAFATCLIIAHVHQHWLDAGRFDLGTLVLEVLQCLKTKGTAEVTKEHEHHW